MLTVLLTFFMFSQGLSQNDTGTVFITAFPENIAYYHLKVLNYLKITSIHNNTDVTVIFSIQGNANMTTKRIFNTAGVTWSLNLAKEFEVYQNTSSRKSILIKSNDTITVVSMSGWPGRFQSHVVAPMKNLGTVYHIPTLNYTKLVASFGLTSYAEPGYDSFRLLVINAVNQSNTITVKRVNKTGHRNDYTINLDNYNLVQLQTNGKIIEINGTDKIAVIFTHPCFNSKDCLCNMVMNQLRPAKPTNVSEKFLVPFNITYPSSPIKQLFLTTNYNVTVVNGSLLNETGNVQLNLSTDILPLLPGFNHRSQLITTSVPVSLTFISPGIILDLIPVSRFSGCYLVHFNSISSEALVIAETSSARLVHFNSTILPATNVWNPVNGSYYSWTIVSDPGANTSTTIWHPDTKISVYVIENWGPGNIYGSPAISISEEPDPKGCAVTPGTFVLGDTEMNWYESLEYCKGHSDHFARLFRKQFQDRITQNITVSEPIDGWISLRRDLFNREWYWRNEDELTPNIAFTYWDQQQPDVPEKGLCASVFMDPAKTFKWKSSRCCSKKKPVCYKNPEYLRLV